MASSTENTAQIVATQFGAYDNVVQLAGSTKQRRLVEVLNEIAPASGAVVDHFNVTNNLADVAKDDNTYSFSESSKPSRLLWVPTLEEMGYSDDTHKVQIIGIAHLRSVTPPTDVEIRLVDKNGVLVTGSVATGEVTTSASDSILKTPAVDVPDGAGYTIDMKVTDSSPVDVTLNNRALLVRIVKK